MHGLKREYTVEEFRAGKIPGLKRAGTRGVKVGTAPRVLRVVALDRVELELPVFVVSEANEREHWAARGRRKNAQQDEVAGALAWVPRCPVPPPWRVTFVLLAREDKIDTDNFAGAFKHVRDEVARWLGCGDGKRDPVTWSTAFEKSDARGLRVVIERRER
jgi:hypothetical protein